MIYITGDTHGDFRRIAYFADTAGTAKDDILIILGDAGINYDWNRRKWLLEQLADFPITMFCIHGNHEMRPQHIPSYIKKSWHGGVVYVEPEYPNVLFAQDGDIYTFDEKKCIVIGGAYSIDKDIRLANGFAWWSDEQPSEEIKKYVERNLEKHHNRVDVVLSHTCPLQYEPREVFLDGYDDAEVDKSTESWLGEIEGRITYTKWYCGHYHTEKQVDKLEFLFQSIRKL